jgi:hypothetical protein
LSDPYETRERNPSSQAVADFSFLRFIYLLD